MKITVIISALLIVQVSASFFDVFQGAMQSVQNGFGKLLSDVVTDVKDTVDCTILAVEHVLSLSEDATARYYEKCGSGIEKNSTKTNPQVKDGNFPTVEISISNNEEYLKKEIPEQIDARINATLTKFLSAYNPHDRLEDVEIGLVEGTQRLADVSELVKQELDKLSGEIHFDLKKLDRNDSKPSIDSILEELKLLEAIEQNVRNTSEANEVHKVIDDVLHKLNAIESSDVAENARVERILKDLENNTNSSYTDLRKQLKDLKIEEAIHLDLIKNKMEEHEKSPTHLEFIRNSNFNNTKGIQSDADINNITNSLTTAINVSLLSTKQLETFHKDINNTNDSKDKTTFIEIQLDANSNSTSTNISSTSLKVASTTEIATKMTTYSGILSVKPTVPSIDNPKGLTSTESHEVESPTTTRKIFIESITEDRSLGTDIDEHLRDSDVHNNKTTSTPDVKSMKKSQLSVQNMMNEEPSSSTTNQPSAASEKFESSTINSNDNSKSTWPSTTIDGKDVTSRTSEHVKSALLAKELSTLKIENQQTSSVHINDVSTTTAPHVITTSSYVVPSNYVNDNTTPADGNSSVSITIPHTSTSLTPRILNQEHLFNQLSNVTLKSTTAFVTIETTTVELISPTTLTTPKIIHRELGDGGVQNSDNNSQKKLKTSITSARTGISSTASTPLVTAKAFDDKFISITPPMASSRILTQQQISQQTHINDYGSMIDHVNTTTQPHITQSTICAFCDHYSSTTTKKALPTLPIPILDASPKYIDHVITTTALPSTNKLTESPAPPRSTHASNTLPERVKNERPSYDRSNNPDALNVELHDPTGFMPPQNVPPLYATNNPTVLMTREYASLVPSQKVHNEPLPYTRLLPPAPTYTRNDPTHAMNTPAPLLLLPSPRLMPSQGAHDEPPPYARSNLIALVNKDASSNTPTRLMPLQSAKNQPLIQTFKDENPLSDFVKRPPTTINELSSLTTNRPLTTPKTNNFDDPDYDSFFHIPAKDTEAHDQAVRDARKLIEDSQRAHHVIDSILNNKNKGRSVFGLPKPLKIGK